MTEKKDKKRKSSFTKPKKPEAKVTAPKPAKATAPKGTPIPLIPPAAPNVATPKAPAVKPKKDKASAKQFLVMEGATLVSIHGTEKVAKQSAKARAVKSPGKHIDVFVSLVTYVVRPLPAPVEEIVR